MKGAAFFCGQAARRCGYAAGSGPPVQSWPSGCAANLRSRRSSASWLVIPRPWRRMVYTRAEGLVPVLGDAMGVTFDCVIVGLGSSRSMVVSSWRSVVSRLAKQTLPHVRVVRGAWLLQFAPSARKSPPCGGPVEVGGHASSELALSRTGGTPQARARSASSARSARRSTLPTMVLGRLSRNSTCRGTLYPASF